MKHDRHRERPHRLRLDRKVLDTIAGWYAGYSLNRTATAEQALGDNADRLASGAVLIPVDCVEACYKQAILTPSRPAWNTPCWSSVSVHCRHAFPVAPNVVYRVSCAAVGRPANLLRRMYSSVSVGDRGQAKAIVHTRGESGICLKQRRRSRGNLPGKKRRLTVRNPKRLIWKSLRIIP